MDLSTEDTETTEIRNENAPSSLRPLRSLRSHLGVSMTRHVVGRAEEIPPGGRKIVRVAGRGEIGVFNVDGAFYALKNTCAHQGSRVCLGKIVGTALPSDVYEYRYGREGEILRCPWHEWEYDIKTGESVFDPKVRITTYPVEVVDGDVTVVLD